MVSLKYVLEVGNVITAGIILLQGVGSGWTKHYQNMAMYLSFWLLTLASAIVNHLTQSAADSEVNDQRFYAALLGSEVAFEPSTAAPASSAAADPAAAAASGLRGFCRVSAAQLGMGNIVAVLPGQRVPIEGYVLPAPLAKAVASAGGAARVGPAGDASAVTTTSSSSSSTSISSSASIACPHDVEAAPFSYAVTGENTVAYPAFRSLPLPFTAIARVECKLLEDGEAAAEEIPVLTARTGSDAAALPAVSDAAAAAAAAAHNKTAAAAALPLSGPVGESAKAVRSREASAAAGAAELPAAQPQLAIGRLSMSASTGHGHHPFALTGRGAFTTAPAYDPSAREPMPFALPFVSRDRTRSAADLSSAATTLPSAAAQRLAGQRPRNSPRSRSFDRGELRRSRSLLETHTAGTAAAGASALPPSASPSLVKASSEQSATATASPARTARPAATGWSTEPRLRRPRRGSGSPSRSADSNSELAHHTGAGTSGSGLARFATKALVWGRGQLLDKFTLEPPRAGRVASPRLPADPDARALRLGGSDTAFAAASAEAIADAHDADVAEALETGGAAAEALLRASAAAAVARTFSDTETAGTAAGVASDAGSFEPAPVPLTDEMLRRSLAEDASSTAGGVFHIDAEVMLQQEHGHIDAHQPPARTQVEGSGIELRSGIGNIASAHALPAVPAESLSRMTSVGSATDVTVVAADGGLGAPLALSDFVFVGADGSGRGSAASVSSGVSGTSAAIVDAPAAEGDKRHARADADLASAAAGRISASSADSDARGGIVVSSRPDSDSPPALPSPPSSERGTRATPADAGAEAAAPQAEVVAPVASPALAPATASQLSAPAATLAALPSTSVSSAAPQAALSSKSSQPVFIYLVNGARVPARCDRVPRGVVHAPEAAANDGSGGGQLTPLFILAALPRRFESEESGAHAAADSSWSYTIRRVFYIQIAVLVVFSLQGTLAGAEMTREAQVAAGSAVAATYTLAAFLGFLLGHAVMANTLLPLRESLVNAILLGICKALLPGVRVRNDLVLETVRSVRNVVSDKTGTITIDSMAFRWPIRSPAWTDAYGLGPALLFCTNDSKPNPLFKRQLPNGTGAGSTASGVNGRAAGDAVDPRLASTPALCTTSEEGAIFHSLTTPLGDRDFPGPRAPDEVRFPDEGKHFKLLHAAEPAGTSPGLLILHDVAGSRLLRVLLHHRGGFIPSLVARLSVASFAAKALSRSDGEALPPLGAATLDPSAAGAALAGAGWVAVSPPLLVVQGGGDAVARCCGPAAAAFERSELEADPNRTFGHAVALFAFPHLCYEAATGASATGSALSESALMASSQVRRRGSSGGDSSAAGETGTQSRCASAAGAGMASCLRTGSAAVVSAAATAMMDIRSLGRPLRVAGEAVVKAHASSARAAAVAAARAAGGATPASSLADSRHGSSMFIPHGASEHALMSSSIGSFLAGSGAGSGAGASASSSGLAFSLTHLSKFVNPICPGAEWLSGDLASQGVRLHLCSGDTLLTLRSVAQDMRILRRDGDDLSTAAAAGHASQRPSAAAASASSSSMAPVTTASAATTIQRTRSAGPPPARSVELTWDESVVPAMQVALRGLRAEVEAQQAIEAAELAAEAASSSPASGGSGSGLGGVSAASRSVASPFASPLSSLTALLAPAEDSDVDEAADGGDATDHESGDATGAPPAITTSSSLQVAARAAAIKGPAASLPGGQSLHELAAQLESSAQELRRLAGSSSGSGAAASFRGASADDALCGMPAAVPTLMLASSRMGHAAGAGAGAGAQLNSDGSAASAAGGAQGLESPFAVALRTLDAQPRSRLCVFVCADVLLLLHAHVDLPAVASLLGHPRVVLFFYRIKASLKPLAVDLMSAVEGGDAAGSDGLGSAVGSTAIVSAGGSPSAAASTGSSASSTSSAASRCIFMGDGPNDAPALSRTPHSVAMRVGSVLARNVANVEAESSVALPELITLARLFHGGRAVVLRDVVFVGTCTVLLLSVAAHISGFETVGGSASSTASAAAAASGGRAGGSRVKMFADAWSPIMMLIYTMMVHTPRMLVQALAEGLRPEWQDHGSLIAKVGGEVLLALCCSLWTGMRLKHSIADASNYPAPSARAGAGSSSSYVAAGIQMYAPLALASLALLTYLRQNLIISSRLRGGSTLRLLPPRATGVVAAQMMQGKAGAAVAASGAGAAIAASPNGRAAHAGWKLTFVSVLNGLPGQLLVFVLYLALVSHRRLPVSTCFTLVLKSVAAPAVLMGVYRLLTALNANTGRSIEAGVRRFAARGVTRA